MKVSPQTRERIKAEILRTDGQGNGAMTRHILARSFGVGDRTLSRIWREVEQARRREAPTGRISDAEVEDEIMALMAQYDFTPDHIRDIILYNYGEELCSVSTINRILREKYKLSRKKIKTMIKPSGLVKALDCIRLKAKKSNQVWQLDFSVAEQYFIDASGAIDELSPLTHSKNKNGAEGRQIVAVQPGGRPQPGVIRLVLSRPERRVRPGFPGARDGEENPGSTGRPDGAPAWVSNDCIAPPSREDGLEWVTPNMFPFCGVPEIIYTDNDNILKAKRTIVKSAMTRLGVEIQHHLPGHSHAKGKVENSFWIMDEFEKVTKAKRFRSLYDANYALFDHLIKINQNRKAFPAWLSGLGQLRMLDREDLVKRLFLQEIDAFIHNDCRINHKGIQIYLPREQMMREQVGNKCRFILPVNYQEGDELAIVLRDTEYWVRPIDPIVADTGKEFKSLKKTDQQRVVEAALEKDLSHLELSGFCHKLSKYQEEYELPVGESYRPETLQPVRGRPRKLMYAVTRFMAEGMVSRPITKEESNWIQMTLFTGRSEVFDSDIEALIRDVKTGGRNVGDKVAAFHAAGS